MELLSTPLAEKADAARRRLDAHVREMVAWHFDPATGCPFWLERAATLGFDPRRAVGGYSDLALIGHNDDAWLRGGPVRRWVPKPYENEPLYVFETGGTTGLPKTRVNVRDFQIDYELFSDTLSEETFPRGSDWLMLGPTGPRRLRLAIEHLCQHRGGICFMVDLDPRWVNRLVKLQRWEELEEYKRHAVDQALKTLRGHDGIRCLFTTPKLLEALCEHVNLPRQGITGIFCGGTEMNAQFHRFAREELVPGIDFVPTYGNTLMGLACHRPYGEDGDYSITYYPPAPRAVFEIVDPDDTGRTVDYGETGRVMLTTLTRELFMPRFLERDEGERAAPIDLYPWDGVSNLRLFSRFATSVAIGVY